MKKTALGLTLAMLMSCSAPIMANDTWTKSAVDLIVKIFSSKEAQMQATRMARETANSSAGRNWVGKMIANIRFKKALKRIWG